jgi:hypothetical protein
MSDEKKTYKVGYKKPPQEYKFKKGQPSPNPKGRKKGSRNVLALYRDILEEKIKITENGKQKTITVQEGIIRRVASDALKGKDRAIERALQHAPKCEEEEQRYTMTELAEKMNWDGIKGDDEFNVVIRFLGLEKQMEEFEKKMECPKPKPSQ